ncbi:MAG: hypothetical protein ABI700_25065 [Chloroflexota bacterium]
MKKRISLSLLILALLVAAIVPASAQSSVDPTLLSFVQSAFTNTLAVNSLSVDVNTSTDTAGLGNGGANGGGGFGGFGVNRTASYQLASNASDDWNVSGTTSTTTAGGPAATAEANSTPVDNTTTEEIRIVDGKTYIRFTAIPQRMQQQNPPADWVDVATLPAPAQGTFGGNFATSAPTANQILEALSLPVDATGVSAITEQVADTIDGAAMRVFQVTVDVDALLKSDAAASLFAGGFGRGGGPAGFGGGRGGFGGNRPGGNGGNGAQATPPVNAPAGAPAATVEAPSSANTQVTLTVWIGADNFVYRITSAVARTGMGQDGQGSTTLTTTTDFANFNQPMTITAPTAGS